MLSKVFTFDSRPPNFYNVSRMTPHDRAPRGLQAKIDTSNVIDGTIDTHEIIVVKEAEKCNQNKAADVSISNTERDIIPQNGLILVREAENGIYLKDFNHTSLKDVEPNSKTEVAITTEKKSESSLKVSGDSLTDTRLEHIEFVKDIENTNQYDDSDGHLSNVGAKSNSQHAISKENNNKAPDESLNNVTDNSNPQQTIMVTMETENNSELKANNDDLINCTPTHAENTIGMETEDRKKCDGSYNDAEQSTQRTVITVKEANDNLQISTTANRCELIFIFILSW